MIDRVEIVAKAGTGGNGVISFRREKFVPFGGPDGGDGGDGGNIIIKADAAVTSLRKFKPKRFYRAGDGKNGSGKKKHGKSGENVILIVPAGTLVLQKTAVADDALIADLTAQSQQVIVA